MELAPQQRKSHHDTGQTRKNVRSCFFFFFFFFFFFSVERDPFFWMGTNPREPFDDALATGRLTSFLIHRRVLFFFFFFFTKKDKRKKQNKSRAATSSSPSAEKLASRRLCAKDSRCYQHFDGRDFRRRPYCVDGRKTFCFSRNR